MKSVCIVPFTSKEFSIAASLEKDYIVSSVVSPQGIGIDGKDIGIIKNREQIGICCTSDIEKEVERNDAVLISDCDQNLRPFALKAMEVAIEKGKEIFCFLSLNADEERYYDNKCKESNIHFTYFRVHDISSVDVDDYQFSLSGLPTIFVGEVIDNSDGNEIYYKILNYFSDKKYQALGISEDIYGYMFGQVPIKFYSDIDPEQAVLKLNCYVSQSMDRIRPDIIVVKLPKPIIKFSDLIHYDFGITAYMTANAIPADHLLLCTPSGIITPPLLEVLDESFTSKLGVGISGVHIGNQMIDNSYEYMNGHLEFAYDQFCNSLAVADEIKKFGYASENYTIKEHLYNLLDGISSEFFMLPYGVI